MEDMLLLVPTLVDAGSQTEQLRQDQGTQCYRQAGATREAMTQLSGEVVLPRGWTVDRLVGLAVEQPGRTIEDLALVVSRSMEEPTPATQLNVVQLLLRAADTMRVRIMQRVSEIAQPLSDPEASPVVFNAVRAAFDAWFRDISRQRPVHSSPIFATPPPQTARRGRGRPSHGRRDVPDTI